MQFYLFSSTDYIQSSINLCFTLPDLNCQPVWNTTRRLDKIFLFILALSLSCLEQENNSIWEENNLMLSKQLSFLYFLM